MMEKRNIMLVGLNNPHEKYERTRHNIGFESLYDASQKFNVKWFKQDNADIAVFTDKDYNLIFVRPLSSMNRSGIPVAALAFRFEVKTEDIIVFHDDIDLPPGKIKAKRGGSPAGHNGLKSIDRSMGTEYTRVRIGVGRPTDNTSILDYVLGDFTDDDVVWISDKLGKISENVQLLIDHNYEEFMKKCM